MHISITITQMFLAQFQAVVLSKSLTKVKTRDYAKIICDRTDGVGLDGYRT
jgi:hypothetical protein